MDVQATAQSLGLTRKQFVYYAAWYAGETHQRIADRFEVPRPSVSEVIGRALQRRPDLPRPPRRIRSTMTGTPLVVRECELGIDISAIGVTVDHPVIPDN